MICKIHIFFLRVQLGKCRSLVNTAACHILIAVLRKTKRHVVIYSADSSGGPIKEVSLDFARKIFFGIQGIEEDAVVFAPLVYVHLSSFFHGVLPQLDGSCGNGRLRRAVCIALGRQGKAGDNLI